MMNDRPEYLSVSARHSDAISDRKLALSEELRSEFESAWERAQ